MNAGVWQRTAAWGQRETVWESQTKNLLPITLFLSLFFSPALATLTSGLQYLSDAVIGVMAATVAWRLLCAGRMTVIPLRYLLVFLLFLYVAVAGVALNQVSPLVIVAGIRSYFKYIPLFLLPFVVHFTGRDVRLQFKVLIGLALIQLPVTVWQRFIRYADTATGDGVSGTLTVSNSLTIFMLALITALTALYLRRRISLGGFVVTSLLLFLPTTLNETKVTVFLLPVGIGSVLFIMRREIGLRSIMLLSLTGLILLVTFVAVYDHLYAPDVGFFKGITNKSHILDNYNMTGIRAAPDALRNNDRQVVGAIKSMREEEKIVGRLDSFQIPVEALHRHDPTRLLLGLGIGNVNSSIGDGGAYRAIAKELGGIQTSLSMLLWETGLAGTALYVLFLLLVARDAAALSRAKDNWGALAAGWFGVTLIIIATLPYNTLFHFNELACLFVYFGGVVVCQRRIQPKAELRVQASGDCAEEPTWGVPS